MEAWGFPPLTTGSPTLLARLPPERTGNCGSVGPLLRLLLSLAVVLAACGGSASAEKQAEDLASLAAEGAILAHDAAEGDTTSAFTRVHARELRDAAVEFREQATDAHVATLARRAEAALDALARDPGDGRGAAEAERELRRAADALSSLGP